MATTDDARCARFEAALLALPEGPPHIRGAALDALRRTWDTIDPNDLRWGGIEALLVLDHEGVLCSNLAGVADLRDATTLLLDALRTVDAEHGGESVHWATMRRLKDAIEKLSIVYRELEDELALAEEPS